MRSAWIQGAFAVLALLIAVLAGPVRARNAGANSFQPLPGLTGAPPSEDTCFQCHTGGLDDGVGSISIQGVPGSYTPGQTYPITVVLDRTGQKRWGFEITVLRLDNTMAGTLADTSLFTASQTSAGRTYISHTSNGAGAAGSPTDGTYWSTTANGPASWTFLWTAPAAGAGAATFYAAGNAANGNGINGLGDFIYTTNASSAEGPATDVDAMTWGRIKTLYR